MSDKIFGTDWRVVYLDDGTVDLAVTPQGDIDTVSGIDNLKQAIILRILTKKGERNDGSLGSDLYALYGSPNILGIREFMKVLIMDALVDEPRISEIQYIEVEVDPDNRQRVSVTVQVVVIKSFITVDDEPFTYDENESSYQLKNQYVYSIGEVRGIQNGDMIYFYNRYDFIQSGDNLVWIDTGRKPDHGTNVLVDYTYFDLSQPQGEVLSMTFPFNLGS